MTTEIPTLKSIKNHHPKSNLWYNSKSMSKNEITTKTERLNNAVNEIGKLCFDVKNNILELCRKIYNYDKDFKDEELKFELERKNILKGTTYYQYRTVGAKNILHDLKYRDKLPSSVFALIQLAYLKDDKIKKDINSGKINASMTIDDTKNLKSLSNNSTNNSDLTTNVFTITGKRSVVKKNKEKLKKLKREIQFKYPFLNVNDNINE